MMVFAVNEIIAPYSFCNMEGDLIYATYCPFHCKNYISIVYLFFYVLHLLIDLVVDFFQVFFHNLKLETVYIQPQ